MARLTLDGVPAAVLAVSWGVPQAGYFRRLPSSLDAIHDLAAQGAPEGSVVIAEEQTAGRGREGRPWRSPPGGVWLGLLLRPAQAEPGGSPVAIRAGLAVADVIDALLGRPAARLKWPNDVLLDDRKLAGVLCEGRWQGMTPQWLAVGVGINVCNEIPPELARHAVALRDALPGVRRIDVLDRLVPLLSRLGNHGARLTEAECAAFGARDWLRGRLIRRPIFGRALGPRPDGALMVDAGGVTTAVREGHVELA
ncbi:MAG: biotin--[acetyl-CoA-carboxylase] ligase [Gemmatimonadales bacterium]